ncbi:MAG: hypothetical protein ABI693_21015 [Bryobacteraceae bacterium]
MPAVISIHGDGLAACCAARLLTRRGFHLDCRHATRAASPTLLFNQSTRHLLTEVFDGVDELLSDCLEIRQRVVLWGPVAAPVAFPHAGWTLDEGRLLNRLWLTLEPSASDANCSPAWSLYSSAKTASGVHQTFGTRVATAITVRLWDRAADSCWVESLEDGWLFLLPSGNGQASLLATGAAPEVLLSKSRLIAPQVDTITGIGVAFPTSPRILQPLAAPSWIACGSAALSFDPICGEGAGNAVREAILAAAVIAAIENGADAESALAHYSARLLAGFLRHLNASRQFYASAGEGDWWLSELAELDRGIAWTHAQLAALPPARYGLRGFDLERL